MKKLANDKTRIEMAELTKGLRLHIAIDIAYEI